MLTTNDFSIKHAIPGRLRVVFPALVSEKNLTRRLKSHFAHTPGINGVRSNHFCGSITIQYNPEIFNKERILHLIDGFRWDDPVPSHIRISSTKEQSVVPHPAPMEMKKNRFHRLWNVAGSISIGIGIVGVFVPLLPTVPLFLLAGFCYWRGSPRFYNRLINFGPVGRLIDNFRNGNGLPAKMKSRAIVFMWVSMATSMVFFVESNTLRTIMVLVGIGVTLYILRIKTSKPIAPFSAHLKNPEKKDPIQGE